jgi:sugar (pentulose or hexulose) kinase
MHAQVPSFTSTKLLWLQRHEPEAWAQLASVLLPHDYINFWLTGHKVTEVRTLLVTQYTAPVSVIARCEWLVMELLQAGDASGTWLLDVAQRRHINLPAACLCYFITMPCVCVCCCRLVTRVAHGC